MASGVLYKALTICSLTAMGLFEPGPAATTTNPAHEARRHDLILSVTIYPDGIDTVDAYQGYLRRRIEALLASTKNGSDPTVSAEHLLGAANLVLAFETEPWVTWMLLAENDEPATASMQKLVDEALKYIAQAEKLLGQVTDQEGGADQTDQDEAAQLRRRDRVRLEHLSEDLGAFAAALAYAFGEQVGPESIRDIREAASLLAVLLEDERPGVAASATLYEALLFKRANMHDRALAVLGLALQPLPKEHPKTAFFSRLLRCRYLAQNGAYATSWSLLLRLEELAQDWFKDEQTLAEATTATELMRLEVAKQWMSSLGESGAESERGWCQDAILHLETRLFGGDDSNPVLRMGAAIPLLLDIPLLAEAAVPAGEHLTAESKPSPAPEQVDEPPGQSEDARAPTTIEDD